MISKLNIYEAAKAVTPRIEKKQEIKYITPERKVESVSSGSNNPRKRDERTPYEIYEDMRNIPHRDIPTVKR